MKKLCRITIPCFLCVLLVVMMSPHSLAKETDWMINIRLSKDSCCVLSDGSLVLGGTDAYSGMNSETVEAVMMCFAPNEYTNAKWECRFRKEEGVNHNLTNISPLPDGSILACLSVFYQEGEQDYLVIVKDGLLVSEIWMSASLINMAVVSDGVLTQVFDSTSAHLTLFNLQGQAIWSKNYNEEFIISRFIEISDGYYLAGTIDLQNREFAEFVAKLNRNGDIVWSRIEAEHRSRFFDAAVTSDGHLIAVGGVYEASDGSSWPKAHIICYDANGNTEWKQETAHDEGGFLWSVIKGIDHGFIIAGTNHMEPCIKLAYYNFNGENQQFWDEPVSEEIDIQEYLDVLIDNRQILLFVTGDTRWLRLGKEPQIGQPLYSTFLCEITNEGQ